MSGRRTIGSVPYLNARPLVAWFTDTEAGRQARTDVVDEAPSKLAVSLERGRVAAALLSSVEALRHPEFVTYPLGIACTGPVESVRIFAKKPIGQVKSVALDASSLTSVALTKIVLSERYGLSPVYAGMPPEKEAMLAEHDAALLIGDAGYRDYDGVEETIDLGAVWAEMTGLPFVYALWIGRKESMSAAVTEGLAQAGAWGMAHLPLVAQTYAPRHGETLERARHYLCDVVEYELTARHEKGLEAFRARLERHGLL